MSKKRTSYSSAFKTKLVLELLQNESTLAEIASKHSTLPQNLVNWRPSLPTQRLLWSLLKQLKNTRKNLLNHKGKMSSLTALAGKATVEKEWLAKKKLKSLDSSKLK